MVTFIWDRVTPKAKGVMDSITAFFAAAVCFVLSVQSTLQAIYSFKSGEFAGALEVPIYPAKFIFAFGCLLTAFVLTTQSIKAIRLK